MGGHECLTNVLSIFAVLQESTRETASAERARSAERTPRRDEQ